MLSLMARRNFLQELAVFACCFLLYLLNRFLLKDLNVSYRWLFTSYYNDFLAPLLLLSYTNMLLLLHKRSRCLHFGILSAYILAAGLIWEFAAPRFIPSTTDWTDIAVYYGGFLAYWSISRLFLRAGSG